MKLKVRKSWGETKPVTKRIESARPTPARLSIVVPTGWTWNKFITHG